MACSGNAELDLVRGAEGRLVSEADDRAERSTCDANKGTACLGHHRGALVHGGCGDRDADPTGLRSQAPDLSLLSNGDLGWIQIASFVVTGLLAMAAVAAAGLVVRKPLARVPENTLKYAVGIVLTAIGTFWAAEGMGAKWPLDFVSILFLVAAYLGASQLAVQLVRRPALA